MEVNQEGTSPFEGVFWSSPEELFPNHLHAQRELISTPNVSTWPMHTLNLEGSEGSSKTDSGYCSLTPHSADSLGRMVDQKCHSCCSHNYVQSTPNCTRQKKCFYENQSLHLEYMEPITESRLSPAQTNSFRNKQSSTLDLYDDAMDSSLYETDVQQTGPSCSQECMLGQMEIGEEKSIDFTDSGVCLPNSSVETNTSKFFKQTLGRETQENGMDSDEYFSPEAHSFGFNVVSPKVQNETTPKKVKNRGKFYSVANNIYTMNKFIRSFNLNGIDEVDFLYQLGVKKNCPNIISKIFDLLSNRDLDSVRVVSKTWNQLFLSDIKAYNRWKLYKNAAKMKIENYFSPKTRGSEGRLTLFNITNQNSPTKEDSPSRSPPVSPRSIRFHSFQKAAKTLKKGERLLSCPRCHFPSHDRGSPNVQCSRSGCQHRFCVWCRNETLSETQHNCPPLYTPLPGGCRSTPRIQRIGSKNSKRNLRRL